MNAAIAKHLNILESAIIRIEEWANVLFVVARGIGARFVSKKVVPQKMEKTKGDEVADKLARNFQGDYDYEKHSYISGADGNIDWYMKRLSDKQIKWIKNVAGKNSQGVLENGQEWQFDGHWLRVKA